MRLEHFTYTTILAPSQHELEMAYDDFSRAYQNLGVEVIAAGETPNGEWFATVTKPKGN